ncbi:ABC transporter substrate-binding protein [Thermoanaerobacteraceae bacterium SP2]|nr:ABC transporter substrate-binding protein [Thermoanaerobacteraceae bacterium SP2]
MKKSRYIASLFLIVLLIVSIVGCGQSGQQSTQPSSTDSSSGTKAAPIKLGLVGPMTGPNAQAGNDMKNGAEMAIKEINNAGGINGHMLELIVEDDRSVPAESVSAMENVIRQGIVGVIGTFNSSCTIANMEVAKREGVPQITVSAADSITQKGNQYMFRHHPYTTMFAEGMVDYIAKNLKNIKTLAILGENTDYGLGIIKSITDLGAKNGIKVVDVQNYNPGDTDFYSQLTKVKAKNPDGILIAGDRTEGAQIVRQGKELGLDKKQWFGFLSMSTYDFHKLAGGAEDGMIVVSCFEPVESNPVSIKFYDNVMKELGVSPSMHLAISYDAVYLFAEALKGIDYNEDLAAYRKATRDQLAKIKDFPGVLGKITFGPDGQADIQVFVAQWKGGKKVVLFPTS